MRIAIVTGASSGIGREFVREIPHFYKHLDEIWVIARRKERLKNLEKTCGQVKIRVLAGDLVSKEMEARIQAILSEEQPQIRMLVNAAGYGKTGYFEEISLESQLGMADLNCRALTFMTGICLPYMDRGSRIIQIASSAAFGPQPGFAVYAASKAYVYSFSLALRSELKSKGIVVTAVCPGPVNTEFFDHIRNEEDMGAPGEGKSRKDMFLTSAESVVHQALLDSRKKKAVSVDTFMMRGMRTGAKCIPYVMIAEIMKAMNWSEEGKNQNEET